jgi:hypothetical protein
MMKPLRLTFLLSILLASVVPSTLAGLPASIPLNSIQTLLVPLSLYPLP